MSGSEPFGLVKKVGEVVPIRWLDTAPLASSYCKTALAESTAETNSPTQPHSYQRIQILRLTRPYSEEDLDSEARSTIERKILSL